MSEARSAEFELVYRRPTGAERPGPFDKLRVPNIVSMLSMVSQSNHEAWASKKMNGLKEWIPDKPE